MTATLRETRRGKRSEGRHRCVRKLSRVYGDVWKWRWLRLKAFGGKDSHRKPGQVVKTILLLRSLGLAAGNGSRQWYQYILIHTFIKVEYDSYMFWKVFVCSKPGSRTLSSGKEQVSTVHLIKWWQDDGTVFLICPLALVHHVMFTWLPATELLSLSVCCS